MTKVYNFKIVNTYVDKDDADYVSEEEGEKIIYNWYENLVNRIQREDILSEKIN